MGLASSQARILMLTARKSDLEFRAQMVNQRKINLGMQTQELATKYANSMSNRQLSLAYFTEGNSGQALTQNLSYAALTSEIGNAGSFLVTDAQGKYVYRNPADAERIYEKLQGTNQIEAGYTFERFLQEKCNSGFAEHKGNSILDNSAFFQDALRNGALFIQQAVTENGDGAQTKYKNIAYSSISVIYDNLDTSDDAEAQAEYEAKSIILSNQDKRLDLELQQIQTQHKAIEVEFDGVRKVIDKNVDKTFKIFG